MGDAPTRLGTVRGHAAVWSSDGRIVYAKDDDLYITDGEGSEPHKMLTAPGPPYWPRCSPDGRRLRFTVFDQRTGLFSLWEAAADGSGLRPFLAGWNKPASESCGNWTPDGRYFVFQATRQNETHVWAIKERRGPFGDNSSRPIQLTSGPVSFLRPVPSRDGRKLFAIGWTLRGEVARYEAASGRWMPFLAGLSVEHVDCSRDGQSTAR